MKALNLNNNNTFTKSSSNIKGKQHLKRELLRIVFGTYEEAKGHIVVGANLDCSIFAHNVPYKVMEGFNWLTIQI